jgi:hypothetical protein
MVDKVLLGALSVSIESDIKNEAEVGVWSRGRKGMGPLLLGEERDMQWAG